MTKAQRVLVVVIAFVAGCGGSQVTRLMVPLARANTPVQRWEYHCMAASTDIADTSNEIGKQGWEMVAAAQVMPLIAGQSTVWCFKRALP